MTPATLRRLIANLPEHPPYTVELEQHLVPGLRRTWYRSQREHWVGWLGEYSGAGAYGRKRFDRDAAFAYSHFQCPPGVLWLGEAAGAPEPKVRAAFAAAVNICAVSATRCAAIRRVIPWSEIERLLRRP